MINKVDPDTREQKGGWAPGPYLNTCCECGKVFAGDKRAIMCAPCAYQDDKYDGFD